MVAFEGDNFSKKVGATISSIGGNVYTSYVGLVSESGGTVTVIELENTTGKTFTWTIAVGNLTCTPNTNFTNLDKVIPNCGGSTNSLGATRTLRYDYTNSSTSGLLFNSGNNIVKAPFEIRIYP